ncbi:MAG: sodium:solute symporter family transporter [Terracidiphilus sp.]
MAGSSIYIAMAAVYFAGLILTGILSGRHKGDSNQYLNATSSLPAWVCTTACIAANCGSLDLFAMMALGAQYGMLACHFYWIGAIPALLVVALWLLPAYKRGRNPSILDFISRHYGSSTRSIVALCMAAMMMLIAGVSLCAVAQTVTVFLGWTFLHGVLVAAAIVLFYTWVGGFRATVYTELFHFALVLVAVVPLLFLVAREMGGFGNLMTSIPASRFHAWQGVPLFSPHSVMDGFGLVFGLGLVLSFGFWGTDFVQLQRALAVRREQDAPFIPLSVGYAKLAFSLLVALTGVAAPLVLSQGQLSRNWNATLPSLMLHYYRSVWLFFGFMGLVAGLLSTFSNNVAGFTSAWVQGIYQQWLRPYATDRHYTWVSRVTNAAVVLLAVGAATFALGFQSLMEYIQLILSTFNAPLFALVALAAIAPRRSAGGGRAGFLLGLACSFVHQILALTHVLRYGSQMAANFYGAALGFGVAFAGTLLIGWARIPAEISSNPQAASGELKNPIARPVAVAAIGLAGLFVVFNLVFW